MSRVLLATGDDKLIVELKTLLEELGHTFAGVVPADGTLLESALSQTAEVLLYDAAGENDSRPVVIPGVTVLTLNDEGGNKDPDNPNPYRLVKPLNRLFIKAKLIPVGQIPKAVRLYQQNKKGNSTGPDEFVFSRKSGEPVPIEIRTYPIRTGGRDLVLGIARDISKRRQAEDGLRASEARFRSMFELSPESITLLDHSGRVITTNSKVYEWLGFKPDEIIGKRLSSLPILTKTGLLKVLQQFRRRIKGLDVPPYEAEFNHKDGGKIIGRITANPVRDEKGDISSVLVIISDVTAERRAEEELRASRDLLNRILNGMHDAVSVIGPDYRIREINDSFTRTYGGSREKILGKTCHETTHGRDKPCPEGCHLEKVFKTGKPKTFEHVHLNARGEEVSVEISLFPLQNPEGKVEGVVEMEHDVTLQKLVEKALREEMDRVQTYLDIAGVIILTLDAQGSVTLINQKGCEVLGRPEGEILGKNWKDNFIPDWTRERVEYTFNRLMAGEVDPLRYVESYILTRDEKMRLIAWNNTVFTDDAGNETGTLSSGEDITERRLAETALKESEEKFRNFFENEPEYCYMVSPEGIILDVNRAALSTLGYEKKELVGAPLRRIYAPESHDKMERLLTQWKEMGTPQNEEMIIQTKGGDKRYVLLSATAVLGLDGEPVHSISVQRDITERRQAETALKESEEKYRNLVERANDGIIIVQDERLKYVNPRMA
ncbi:MAG: PAS domain S-box protein [bacterium]|nr:PAS domain S-box protein [bacterium]